MKEWTIKLPKRELLITLLKFIYASTNIKVIERDIRVLIEFILHPLPDSVVNEDAYRFSYRNKKRVIEALNKRYNYRLTGKILSPIIVRLTKQKFLIKQEDNVHYLNPKLKAFIENPVSIKLVEIHD